MFRIIYALLFFIALAPCLKSQPLSFSISAGTAFTFGNLGHKSDFGYTGFLTIEYTPDKINSPELKFISRFGADKFSTDSDSDFSITTVELGLKLDRLLAKSPNMYLLGTAGLAKTDYGSKETSPLISLGLGIESGHFVVESRLVRIFGKRLKETTFLPVTIGVRF